MQAFRSFLVVVLVFGAGLGGGFAWRQGWIELQSPPTGVLDEADAERPQAPEPALPLAAAPATEESESVPLVHFDGLSEPEPLAASPSKPTPTVVRSTVPQISDASVIPAVATTAAAEPPPPARTVEFQEIATSAAESAPLPTEPEAILAEHKELSRLYWREPARRAEIQARIDETARLIFFTPQPHFVEPHVVQPGDRLESIAAKHKLTWEYVSRLNNVDPKRIRAGQRLKLVRGPFSAVVELADFSLTVHLQGYYVKRYSVGIGKDGSTPLGKFPVLNKVANPQYTDPDGKVIDGDDPQNPLGERWIDLGHSYGIHGTIEPDSIGRAASRGCIRLRDADVIEVYDFLVVGSEVAIR